jgi:hypothetical protein
MALLTISNWGMLKMPSCQMAQQNYKCQYTTLHILKEKRNDEE